MKMLPAKFFAQNATIAAKTLLGKLIVHELKGIKLVGRIVETEAYHGADDLACHASRGRTSRTEVLYGQPGLIYVYMIYGRYFCLNIVTGKNEVPSAVLIRAIEPIKNTEQMIKNREEYGANSKKIKKDLIHIWIGGGPGKLCQAMAIDRSINNKMLGKSSGLWIADDGYVVRHNQIIESPRIGVEYAKHCAQWEWNFKLSSLDRK